MLSDTFNTLVTAQADQPPPVPGDLLEGGLLVGRAIYQEGQSTATQIDSAFVQQFTPSALSYHNDLLGLQGGTTSQYYHLTEAQYADLQAGTSSFATSSISSSYSLTASYALNAGGSGGTSLTTGSTYPITSSWAITSSYSLESLSASIATISVSSSFSSTASYALNAGSFAGGELHIEKGIIDGSSFSGNPKTYTINFDLPFDGPNDYVISIASEDPRVWSIDSKTDSGFILNSNSNADLTGSISWRAEDLTGSLGITYYSGSVVSASYSSTSSYSLESLSASLAALATSASFSDTASYALNAGGGGGGTSLTTGSTYPITASVAVVAISASYFSGSISNAVSAVSSSYALSSSHALVADRVSDSAISIPYYDYSLIDYGGPLGQVASASYFTGSYPNGGLVAIITSIYTSSLFIGVSKSLA